MEQTLKELLEGLLNTIDPSKEVLTESVRINMTTKFVDSINTVITENQKLVEARITELDEIAMKTLEMQKEQYESTITELDEIAMKSLEMQKAKLDEQFEKMLTFAIETFDEKSVDELTKCKTVFEKCLDTEIEDLAESIELQLENVLDTNLSESDLDSIAKLEKYENVFESMKSLLFKDIILTSKIDESTEELKSSYDKLVQQNLVMAKKINLIEVTKYLDEHTIGLKPALKEYLTERFENSKLSDVTEKFEEAIVEYNEQCNQNRKIAESTIEKLDINNNLTISEPIIENTNSTIKNISAQYAKYCKAIQ